MEFVKLESNRNMEIGKNVKRIRRKDSGHQRCVMGSRLVLKLWHDIEDIQEDCRYLKFYLFFLFFNHLPNLSIINQNIQKANTILEYFR